ncbi:N-acyl-D-amino-acid deacylase family protein [Flindersiella endophytica]
MPVRSGARMTGDVLVRGGIVVDGTNRAALRADVRVRAGVIAEIGENLAPDGEPVLDADGAYVTPGFIDSHTHFDPVLFWDPLCDPMPQHGVTTVVTGNCSLSLAPVKPADRRRLGEVFAYIEDMPPHVLTDSVAWSWSTWREYATELLGGGYGVNVAAMVGHTALRQFAMGDQAWLRPATAAERGLMAGMLDDCLDAGAFGLSTSLFDSDAAGHPVPSRLADDAELADLLAVLNSRGRRLQFIPGVATHDGILSDVERMAQLCRQHDVVASWNGLFHDERKPFRSKEILDQAERLQAGGAMVFPQVSPRRMDVQVNWSGGMAFYSLPPWHQLVLAPDHEKRRLLANSEWRSAARTAWDAKPLTLIRHRELDRILLISAARPEHQKWVGATLADLALDVGGHPSDVLADWVLANNLNPGVVGIGVMNADPDGVAALLDHSGTVVSNSDAGAHVQMMCAAGDSTLLLTEHVRERGDLSLERAVWELTGRQADLLGLRRRGVITTGAAADLLVFDLNELQWLPDSMVDDLPRRALRLRRPPGGYRYTLVAGQIVHDQGKLTGAKPGRFLLAHP